MSRIARENLKGKLYTLELPWVFYCLPPRAAGFTSPSFRKDNERRFFSFFFAMRESADKPRYVNCRNSSGIRGEKGPRCNMGTNFDDHYRIYKGYARDGTLLTWFKQVPCGLYFYFSKFLHT